MHVKEAASNWLQSVEGRVRSCNWPEFSQLILDRFGRHEILVRQLLQICQSGSMLDYINEFVALVDQLVAY